MTTSRNPSQEEPEHFDPVPADRLIARYSEPASPSSPRRAGARRWEVPSGAHARRGHPDTATRQRRSLILATALLAVGLLLAVVALPLAM